MQQDCLARSAAPHSGASALYCDSGASGALLHGPGCVLGTPISDPVGFTPQARPARHHACQPLRVLHPKTHRIAANAKAKKKRVLTADHSQATVIRNMRLATGTDGAMGGFFGS